MDINTLDQLLKVVNNTLSLTVDTFPGIVVLLSEYNANQPLKIINAVKQPPANGTILVTGNSSFMNVSDLKVTGVFSLDSTGNPTMMLSFEMERDSSGNGNWTFTKSFPNLPDFSQSKITQETSVSLHFLDVIDISECRFILTNFNTVDSGTGVQLYNGLNFTGKVKLKALLGLFNDLLDGDPSYVIFGTVQMPDSQGVPLLPVLHHPWQVSWRVPGIHLKAVLGGTHNIAGTSLTLSDLSFHVYCPIDTQFQEQNPTYNPVAALSGNITIPSAGKKVELTAGISPGLTSGNLFGLISDTAKSINDLSELSDVSGGNDLFQYLPEDIKSVGKTLGGIINLMGIGLYFNNSLGPDLVCFAVGLPCVNTGIAEYFRISNITACFMINHPFSNDGSRSVSVALDGQLQVAGAAFDVSIDYPELSIRAVLSDTAMLSFKQICESIGLTAPSDLSVDFAEISIVPGQGYELNTLMAESTPWMINLGPVPMKISGVQFNAVKPASGTATGTIGGNLAFGSISNLSTRYEIPGKFLLRTEFPEVKLSQLTECLNEIGLELPSGFDIGFGQTLALIQEDGQNLQFQAATLIDNCGLLAFTAKKQGKWGFAIGLSLSDVNFELLPGFAPLKCFHDFLGLEKVMLVVSSLVDPGFTFPDMNSFNAPQLGNKNISLPSQAGGLVQGVNLYAQLNMAKSQAFKALASWLNIPMDGTVGITLAVSCPNPSSNSKLFINIKENIDGVQITGMMGGIIQGGEIGVFLQGKVHASIQGQPMDFDLNLLVLENGLLISGSWNGTLNFNPLPLQLSNLGIIIGMDWEGVPSLGFAATIDVNTFDSSIAVFFDSIDPAKSMFAGAISNLTLKDVAKTIAGQNDIPVIGDVLGLVGLKALKAFDLPGTLSTALDNRDLPAIAAAFSAKGIPLASTSSGVLLRINKAGANWHINDLVNQMSYYCLTKKGDSISVEKQPQIYCAPTDTWIGENKYPQGFHIDAEIDFLLIKTQIQIIIDTSKGISADATLDPITIYNSDFFVVKAASGDGGPRLSLSTFTNPSQTEQNLKDPHFMINGKLRLLGLDISNTYIKIGTDGLYFSISEQVALMNLNLNGSFSSLTNLSAGGAVVLGLDNELDLGPLGSLHVKTNVTGNLKINFNGGLPSATFDGGFTFQGLSLMIPTITLSVTGLANLPGTIWSQVTDIIKKLVTDPNQWLDWIKSGVITGISGADQIGKILSDVYHLSAGDIANKLKDILGYGGQEIAEALKAAGVVADQVGSILKGIGIPVDQIGSILKSIFTGIHTDFSLGHLDTPSGIHTDFHVPLIGHTDFNVPPHIDTGTHIDV